MTILSSDDKLVQMLRDMCGGNLSEIDYYDNNNWHVLLSNNDFSANDRQKIATDAMLSGLTKSAQETIWQAGKRQYFLTKFENASVVNISISPLEGYVIRTDEDSFHNLDDVVSTVNSHHRSTVQQ